MEFVKYLKEQRPGKRLAIFGDGVTDHNSQEFQESLMSINQDLPKEEWLINCTLICSEYPIAKPRRRYLVTNQKFHIVFYHLCSSFKIVKWRFKFFADGQIFI